MPEPFPIERLKALDEDTLRTLVQRYHGMLVRLALSIVNSAAAAEDVAQETWLAVIRSVDRFEGRSSIVGWLASIAVNKARTRAVREARFVPFAEEAEREAAEGYTVIAPSRFRADGHWQTAPTVWDTLDPQRIVAGRELWRHIEAAIAALPPAQRAVVSLRDVAGCDASETCRILEISQENQRVLLHRARARLRAAIEALVAEHTVAGAEAPRRDPSRKSRFDT